MLHPDSPRNRLIGIGLISLTYLFYALLDGGAKWLVRSLPVIELVWLRFASHVLFTGALLVPSHGLALVRTRRPGLQALRALLLLTMTFLNFTALQYLQLAVTSAIFFSVPIVIALLGAPLLGERLDARRWAAIVVGFFGVLVIVRPFGSVFHPAMLLSMAVAVLAAIFSILTRRLSEHDSPETTQFLSALGATAGLAPFAVAEWRTPASLFEWGMAMLLGVFGGLGHYFFAIAHRYAPATVLGPFVYQQVVYMALIGYFAFGDVPDRWVVVGVAIVMASGLYLLLRERTVVEPEVA
jgi:drug/metabolite transporter (DMT)-like permease